MSRVVRHVAFVVEADMSEEVGALLEEAGILHETKPA